MKVGTSRKSISSADDVPPDSTCLIELDFKPAGFSCTVADQVLSTANVAPL